MRLPEEPAWAPLAARVSRALRIAQLVSDTGNGSSGYGLLPGVVGIGAAGAAVYSTDPGTAGVSRRPVA
ncbi:hypothetical protein ABTX99_20695 [Streptomyces flaveolus]|uniref:hypothetical protein n=1 Tax=Streptomyces flaveolus TaxID=67297 RepID=UPI0033175BCD